MEVLGSFMVGIITATCLIQTVGFFTPYWGCNFDDADVQTAINATQNETSPTYCDLQGLYYPDGILDLEIFSLCVSSMVGTWLLTVASLFLLHKHLKTGGLDGLSSDAFARVAIVFFVALQILAGIANFFFFVRYDVLGWSAILFFVLGFPTLLLVPIVLSFVVHRCYELCCGK